MINGREACIIYTVRQVNTYAGPTATCFMQCDIWKYMRARQVHVLCSATYENLCGPDKYMFMQCDIWKYMRTRQVYADTVRQGNMNAGPIHYDKLMRTVYGPTIKSIFNIILGIVLIYYFTKFPVLSAIIDICKIFKFYILGLWTSVKSL
jgi:hypothetical protein